MHRPEAFRIVRLAFPPKRSNAPDAGGDLSETGPRRSRGQERGHHGRPELRSFHLLFVCFFELLSGVVLVDYGRFMLVLRCLEHVLSDLRHKHVKYRAM